MSTVAQVIDRVLRDWLYAPDDQPTRFTLNTSIDSDDVGLVYDDDLLSPEEEDLLGPGTLIEIGSEQILVGSVDADNNTCTGLIRGTNGTTAAAHDAGDLVTLAPTWARKTIFDAVADAVELLWPELYHLATSDALTLSATTHTEVPAVVMSPSFLWALPTGASTYDRYAIQFLDSFPPSTTGKAIYAGVAGSGYLVYKSKFTRPSAETDAMSDLGVEDEWEQLVIVSTIAYLISGKDLSAATQEFLSDSLNAQGFPPDSGRKIRDGLIRYQAYLLDKAKRALRNRVDVVVSTNQAF